MAELKIMDEEFDTAKKTYYQYCAEIDTALSGFLDDASSVVESGALQGLSGEHFAAFIGLVRVTIESELSNIMGRFDSEVTGYLDDVTNDDEIPLKYNG